MGRPTKEQQYTKAIVAAHDKLLAETVKLKLDLQDKAGNYEQRIEAQKKRIYSLEEEAYKLSEEIKALNEKLSKYAQFIADKTIEGK